MLVFVHVAFASNPVPTATPPVMANPKMVALVFATLDANRDGSLQSTELTTITGLSRDFTSLDADKNGKLSKAEYLVWTNKLSNNVIPMFDDYDTNKDSEVDNKEIEKNEMLARDFNLIDTDKNGRISKLEYDKWLTVHAPS